MLLTHRVPRRMSAEVLLDAVNQACGTNEGFTGMPETTRAAELPDPSIPSHFLTTFGRPVRNSPCDCARSSQPDLGQALLMLNSVATLHGKLKVHPQGAAGKTRCGEQDRRSERWTNLYLASLSRMPTDEERLSIRELLDGQPIKGRSLAGFVMDIDQ